MRTIKFRGKRLHDGKWVYGYVLGHDTLPYMAIVTMNNTDKSVINKTTTSVDPDAIGQFTGLYDKNGKEIYEGDIVRCDEFVYEVVYESKRFASFVLRRDKDMYDHYFGEAMECDACEVIGNIHDNQELLEH